MSVPLVVQTHPFLGSRTVLGKQRVTARRKKPVVDDLDIGERE